MKSAIIFNPSAGKASNKKIDYCINFLKGKGFDLSLFSTEKKFDAKFFAQKCLEENFDAIFIAGGDGTINEAIQPLIHSGIKLGLIPLGTANVLARELGIPLSLKKALKLLVEGKEKRVSAAKALFLLKNEERYFLLMAGVGFDAEVVASNSESLKNIWGRFSYVITALQTLFAFAPEKLEFIIEGEEFSGYSALVSNSSHYGGNFKIAKAASLFEPELHSIILEQDSPLDIARVALSAFFKSHPAFEGLQFRISKKIEIKGKAKIQIDGEFAGNSPCVIEAIPYALTFIC